MTPSDIKTVTKNAVSKKCGRLYLPASVFARFRKRPSSATLTTRFR
jgi:hypothetical protein